MIVISILVICSEHIHVECEDVESNQSNLEVIKEVIKDHLYKYKYIYIATGIFLFVVLVGYMTPDPDSDPMSRDLAYLNEMIQRVRKEETNVSPYKTKEAI